jgi:hypothetical protein
MTDKKDKTGSDWWVFEEDERQRAIIRNRMALGRAGYLPEGSDRTESLASILEPLERVRRDFEMRMTNTVCHGAIVTIGNCFAADEKACSQRESSDCPKRIVEYDERLRRAAASGRGLADTYEHYGIPRAIAKLIADGGIEDRPARAHVDAWWQAKPRRRALVLGGASQIGKTIAACDLAARFSGRVVNVPTEFATHLRDDSYQQALQLPALLVLDDLGAESLDGFDLLKSRIDGVFCSRVDAGMYTVITTNAPGMIRERYGDRVAERLNLHGLIIELGNEGAGE